MAHYDSLPTDLARRWGHLPFVRFRGNGEWSAACPQCGDSEHTGREAPDRFRLFAASAQHNARGWCRRCGFFDWADGDTKKTISQEEIERISAERAKLAEQEAKRLKSKIERLREAAYWQGYYEAMTDQQRELWYRHGINDHMIDTYQLGFRADYQCMNGDKKHHTPALSIPHFGLNWKLQNVQYRLLNPPRPDDKYRQTSGLPAAMFLTEPDEELKNAIVMVEGAKKAMVTHWHVNLTADRMRFVVIGVPSKTPSRQMLDALKDADPLYIALDPDAYVPTRTAHGKRLSPAVNSIVKKVGRERARLVKLPCKPDDLFTDYDGTRNDFLAFLNVATAV